MGMIKMLDEEFKDYDGNSGIMPADDKPMEAMPVEEDNMPVNKLSKYNMAKAPGTGSESPYNMAVMDGDQAKKEEPIPSCIPWPRSRSGLVVIHRIMEQ